MKKLLATAFCGALLATAGNAATITFETDEAGFIGVGSVGGTQTGGAPQGPFVAGNRTFTIDADTFDVVGPGTIGLNGETNIEITQNNEGLGIDNNNGIFGSDSGEVDGANDNDILVFTFDNAISLFQVIFENVTDSDDFVFYVPGADPNAQQFDIFNPIPDDTDGDEGLYDFGGLSVTSFGIGALGGNDNFRVSKVVAAVPLPAPAFLLVAGIAGLGAMRRRRKSA